MPDDLTTWPDVLFAAILMLGSIATLYIILRSNK
jgi:hypothetical protein